MYGCSILYTENSVQNLLDFRVDFSQTLTAADVTETDILSFGFLSVGGNLAGVGPRRGPFVISSSNI